MVVEEKLSDPGGLFGDSVGDLQLITAGPEESAPLPESEERGDFFFWD